MKIKLDEKVPDRLVPELERLGHDVDTAQTESLVGSSDDQVWQAAQSGKRFLITQDLDFSDVRRYIPGTHAGMLLVRLARPGRNSLLGRIAALFATEAVNQWHGCIIVATDNKLRIRRPS